jgi:patatin-related protein
VSVIRRPGQSVSDEADMADSANGKDPTKELRLGVVCYGGSSLAIYMHGVTKELNRLVKASALLDADLAPRPDAKSEAFYIDLLSRVAKDAGVRTRVVVDVVAGTSAGGINGIYLTKAIAHNLSQDALRDVWFDNGDMKQLLLLPKSWPVKLRFALLLPRALKKSPLRGNEMAQWLFNALEKMDDGGPQPGELTTLVPRDNRLDLFVTITDFYGYDRQIAIEDPRLVHDQRHRHALTFTYGPGTRDQFQRKNNGALAFAGRATSCFPGVFPPVSFKAFQQWVPKADLSDLNRCFRSHILAGARPEDTQFVDGGVLDNKPFGWAISSIQQRRADVEVDRRLLYLQPDPGDRFVDDSGKSIPPRKSPATFPAILAAVSGLPRQEPILDDLLDVSAHNERVERIRDVIETSFSGVAKFVEEIIGGTAQLPSDPESAEFAGWSKEINEQTIKQAGFAYATYLRLKISATVDRYAQSVCDVCDFPADSNHAQLVRAVVREWAEERKLFQQEGEPTEEQLTFLRELDLGYGQRRLRFVTSALRWWYRDLQDGKPNIPPRDQLDQGKRLLYDAVDKLRNLMSGDAFPDALVKEIAACFPDDAVRSFLADNGLDAKAYLDARRGQLEAAEKSLRDHLRESLAGSSAKLYRDLYDLSQGWAPERRRELLVRYLGFPLWDVLLFPIQALADAGENDGVRVQRMSPYEATVLSTDPKDKVEGKKLMHFWAFFDRHARENDYMWGRLDGAAHLIGILLGKNHPDYRATCIRAFAAILDEDEAALPHVSERVRAIRAELSA